MVQGHENYRKAVNTEDEILTPVKSTAKLLLMPVVPGLHPNEGEELFRPCVHLELGV